MSPWRKLFLGPFGRIDCGGCGSSLTVPLWTLWVGLPIVVIPIPALFDSWFSGAVAFAVVILAAAMIQVWWIPLVKSAN
jgi:hypothetical protein